MQVQVEDKVEVQVEDKVEDEVKFEDEIKFNSLLNNCSDVFMHIRDYCDYNTRMNTRLSKIIQYTENKMVIDRYNTEYFIFDVRAYPENVLFSTDYQYNRVCAKYTDFKPKKIFIITCMDLFKIKKLNAYKSVSLFSINFLYLQWKYIKKFMENRGYSKEEICNYYIFMNTQNNDIIVDFLNKRYINKKFLIKTILIYEKPMGKYSKMTAGKILNIINNIQI